MMNGTVRYRTDKKGTTFFVEFPIRDPRMAKK
jgi:hypothetical protein